MASNQTLKIWRKHKGMIMVLVITNNYSMPPCIYPFPLGGYFICFQVRVINNVPVSIVVHIFWKTYMPISFRNIPKSVLLGHRVGICLTPEDKIKQCSNTIYHLINSIGEFQLLHFLSKRW